MEEILIKALQLILSLSLLVFVHELGHFAFARLFKVRVTKFYMFFNPKFAIVRAKKINGKWQVRWFSPNLPDHVKPMLDSDGIPCKDKKGRPIYVPASIENLDDNDWRKHPESTEWGLGWLPLGGYCSIAGMVDETTDSAQVVGEPQAWEYRSKPAWQRLLIITGGVLMNFLTAIVIYAMMLFAWGKEYLPMDEAYMGYNYCQTALENGFQNGDRIIAVDNDAVNLSKDAVEKIIIEGKRNITVIRNGDTLQLTMPDGFDQMILESKETSFMAERVPFVLEKVMAGSAAEQIAMQPGDSIISINGKLYSDYQSITSELAANANNRIPITYIRQGQEHTDTITVTAEGKIGIGLKAPLSYFKTSREEFGFFAAFPAGWKLGTETLSSYIKQFRLVFTKAGVQSLGGFASIGNLFPGQWSWPAFWGMTAFLSIILAFMNILPIPILDGGYVLFILYEMITRRKPSDRFMEISLTIGMVLLFALLILANGNDLIRILGLN